MLFRSSKNILAIANSKPKTEIERRNYVINYLNYMVNMRYFSIDLAKTIYHYANQRYIIKNYNFEMKIFLPYFEKKYNLAFICFDEGSIMSPEEIEFKKEQIKKFNEMAKKKGSKKRLMMKEDNTIVGYYEE